MRFYCLFISVCIFFNLAQLYAQANWQEVKTLSEQGNLQQAVSLLQSNPQLESADYCYNLGTLHYRLKHFSEAVAYLEKANRIRPHDPDIRNNLKLARSEVTRLIGQDRLDPTSGLAEQVADWLTEEETQAILSLSGMLTLLLWTWLFLRIQNVQKAVINSPSFVALSFFGISVGFFLLQTWVNAHPPAIALSRQVVRSGPGDQYMELGQVEGGSKLRILGSTTQESPSAPQQQTDVWKQIRYSEDGVGWVRSSGLLIL